MEKKSSMGIEAIEDCLLCLICLGGIKDAVMCPYCSKVGCQSCLTRWLGKQKECPHCRKRIESSQLIKCRFVDDVQGHLGRLKKARLLETCPRHDQNYAYFCSPCQQAVCADCVMFPNEPHYGHAIQRVDDVYKAVVASVSEEAEASKQRVLQLAEEMKKLDKQLEMVEKNKQGAINQLKDHLSAGLVRVEQTASEKIAVLQTQQKILKEFSDAVELSIRNFQMAHEERLKFSFIANAPEFSASLQKQRLRSLENNFKDIDLEISSVLSPPFEKFQTFIPTKFSTHRAADAILFSQTLTVDGQLWRLKVYPNGNRHARATHLSIYIELSESHRAQAARYRYKIELNNKKDPSAHCVRCDNSEFKKGDCWGYNKFLSFNQVDSFLQDDTLEIKFSVSPFDYAIKSEDQARYIETLERMLPGKTLVNEMANLSVVEAPKEQQEREERDLLAAVAQEARGAGNDLDASTESERKSTKRLIVEEHEEDDDLPPLLTDDEIDGTEEFEDEIFHEEEEEESASLDHIMRHMSHEALSRLTQIFGAAEKDTHS